MVSLSTVCKGTNDEIMDSLSLSWCVVLHSFILFYYIHYAHFERTLPAKIEK